VIAGRSYRTNAGRLVVDDVLAIRPAKITDAAARKVGKASAAELLTDLPGEPDWPVFRIRFHLDESDDRREQLAASGELDADEFAALEQRLARLDRASSFGAWTEDTLRMIATRPAVRAPDLAASFGRETQPFKLDVRKLKNLGLTYSLAVGYRLAPRGAAYLRHIDRR
jgi:hypothetical protein